MGRCISDIVQCDRRAECKLEPGSEGYKQAQVIRERIRELLKEHREQLLRIGAPGRMLMSGELAEVLPLDDDTAHKAANPLRKDGTVVLDKAEIEAREKSMVARLLAGDEPVAVIVLGAAHDLAEEFEGTGVEYKRVVPSRVEGVDGVFAAP